MSSSRSQWTGRRVLVTGAEGFIGSTLVDMLVEAGAEVRAFVHYKPYAEKEIWRAISVRAARSRWSPGTCGTRAG